MLAAYHRFTGTAAGFYFSIAIVELADNDSVLSLRRDSESRDCLELGFQCIGRVYHAQVLALLSADVD